MPWSGGSFTRTNGVNTGATLWAQDRDDGTKILATRHDTNDQDMADGINSTLEKSGSNAATGNLDIGSNRITLVADGTAKTDVATVNQIQSNGPAFQATDTGTANTYVIALTPAITAYAAGQRITFKAGAASTTASTLNVNTLGAKALKKLHDQDIASGDIESGSIVTAVYDGTNFQVTSQLATEGGTPGGSDTQVQYNSSSAFAGSAHFTFDGTSATVANPLFLPDGSASAPALSNTGDTNTGIAFIAADTVGVVTGGTEQFRFGSNPIHGANKNVLVNGNMQICQRSTSTSGVGEGDTGYVGPDQWYYDESGTTEGVFTISQEDNGGTNGQDLWMKVLCTTEEALGATSDMIMMMQRPEAQNCVQLLDGSSGIAETTVSADIIIHADGSSGLSFPVKVAFSIHTQDGTGRQCTGDVSITANDTWERVSVTFPSDSTATFNADNGLGCTFSFSICGGSARVQPSLTWENDANEYITSNTDNIADQANNYIGITNTQWEVGAVPTSFAYEYIGTTFDKCQRYFKRIQKGADVSFGDGWVQGVNDGRIRQRGNTSVPGPVMRAEPTKTFSAITDFEVAGWNGGTSRTFYTCDTVLALSTGSNAKPETFGMGTYLWTADVASGPAGDDPVWIQYANNDAYIDFTAEL